MAIRNPRATETAKHRIPSVVESAAAAAESKMLVNMEKQLLI
jgi:hypothetical protein